jgi:hypothetical protein
MQKQFVKQKASVPDAPGDEVIRSCFNKSVRSGVERLLLNEAQHARCGGDVLKKSERGGSGRFTPVGTQHVYVEAPLFSRIGFIRKQDLKLKL